jgi:phasin family protein
MSTKKSAAAVDAALKPVESAAYAGKETVESMMKAGSEAAQKGYAQAVQMTKEQVEKTSEAMFKSYDQINTFGKENLEAVVASGSIVAKGVENLSKEVFALAQSSFETSMNLAKAFMGVKSVREAVDLQSELSRTQFDKLMADSAKLTELSMKVANEAFQPIQARFNVAFERMMKPVAA